VDVGADELDTAHYGPAQVDPAEPGAAEVGGAQLRAAEVGPLKPGTTQIGVDEVSHSHDLRQPCRRFARTAACIVSGFACRSGT